MTLIALELLILLLLLLANGLFAMTEMAVVAASKNRLRALEAAGQPGAQAALELAGHPNRFLSSVQLGITLVGLLAGAFGGITLAEQIAAGLRPFPAVAEYAEVIGVGLVVIALTFFSLILGELVPKRLALANPERIACRMARPMEWVSWLARPAVRVLGATTDLVLRVLGVQPRREESVTDEEVKALLQEGLRSGTFHPAEPRMVESVLAFDQRPVRDIMTPRGKLVYLGCHDPHTAIWHKVVISGHSNFPVHDGSRDTVIGMVSVKAIYANLAAGVPVRLRDLMTPALTVREDQTVTELLEAFKKTGHHAALITNASGAVQGMVTLVDVLEAIVGEIPSLEERLKPDARRRDDGSWLVDGQFTQAKLESLLLESPRRAGDDATKESIAGYVAARLGRKAREGDVLDAGGWSYEVLDLDGERIDKLLVVRKKQET